MTLRLPLAKGRNATVISAYTHTLNSDEHVIDAFNGERCAVLSGIPPSEDIIFLGDFNARLGTEAHYWQAGCGKNE